MNIVLWILQVVLALLYFAGGAYKVFSFDEVVEQMVVMAVLVAFVAYGRHSLQPLR